MRQKHFLMVAAVLTLAGCADPNAPGPDGVLPVVPEPVLALAAPYQNLNAVRIGPADNCFWYRHSGPVEVTWLPLRTPGGNPICAKTAEG